MKLMRKIYLLSQIRTWTALSIIINISLISFIIFGDNVLLLIGVILILMVRVIEEKMGYSWYKEELSDANVLNAETEDRK